MNSRSFNDADVSVAAQSYEAGKYEETFPMYKALAESGSIESQVLLGWMYQEGLGVARDANKAFEWFERAASAGSAEGQYYLAKQLAKRKDYPRALESYQKAASQDYSPALFRLGWIYETGRGVDLDRERAYVYYERAAKRGHIFGLKCLALLLLKGQRGYLARVKGLYLFFKALMTAVIVGWRDPYSEQLRE